MLRNLCKDVSEGGSQLFSVPPLSFVQKHGEWAEDIDLRKVQGPVLGAQSGGGDRPWTAHHGVRRSLATWGRRRRLGWVRENFLKKLTFGLGLKATGGFRREEKRFPGQGHGTKQ